MWADGVLMVVPAFSGVGAGRAGRGGPARYRGVVLVGGGVADVPRAGCSRALVEPTSRRRRCRGRSHGAVLASVRGRRGALGRFVERTWGRRRDRRASYGGTRGRSGYWVGAA